MIKIEFDKNYIEYNCKRANLFFKKFAFFLCYLIKDLNLKYSFRRLSS